MSRERGSPIIVISCPDLMAEFIPPREQRCCPTCFSLASPDSHSGSYWADRCQSCHDSRQPRVRVFEARNQARLLRLVSGICRDIESATTGRRDGLMGNDSFNRIQSIISDDLEPSSQCETRWRWITSSSTRCRSCGFQMRPIRSLPRRTLDILRGQMPGVNAGRLSCSPKWITSLALGDGMFRRSGPFVAEVRTLARNERRGDHRIYCRPFVRRCKE
jgi:hypothetical protein